MPFPPARRLRFAFALFALCLFAHGPWLHGAPEEPLRWNLLEEFALASDRGAVLDQLIPGSEDYYYFHCLHAQQTGDFNRVRELLPEWEKRHGTTQHYERIELRQKLLDYARNPEETLEFLRDFLGPELDHRRESPDVAPDLPTRITTAELSAEAFARELLERDGGKLTAFTEDALWLIADRPLTQEQSHELLGRLALPDYPQLVGRIIADLRWEDGGVFGSHPIHSELTLEQLEGCLALMPELLQSSQFVAAYLRQLSPQRRLDFDHDVEAAIQYVDRLVDFSRRLGPVFNGFKAHALYHRLALGRRAGEYRRDLFSEYLSLPRPVPYAPQERLKSRELREHPARLPVDDATSAGLEPVNDDWPLVRDYLLHLFVDDDSFDQYADRVGRERLAPLFAEAKLLAGIGDSERWFSLLGAPARVEELKERIDLEFAPERRHHFAADERVRIEIDIKNVPRLRVAIYPINALNYLRESNHPIDADLPLDGLVPLHEHIVEYEEPSWRRVRRRFDFPELDQPGSYIIEFLGNGRGSRAVVHKGRHHFLQSVTPSGHRFELFGPDFEPLPEGRLWLGGHEFVADANGQVIVPFTREAGETRIVIDSGAGQPQFATYETFYHATEEYELRADFHVERESLLSGETAAVLVRPQLFVADTRVSTSVLTDPRLLIVATDFNGNETRQSFELPLFDDRESVHQIRVPDHCRSLQMRLKARVDNRSLGKDQVLNSDWTKAFNEIESSHEIAAAFFVRASDGSSIELRGKTGEPIPEREVSIEVERREFPSSQDGTQTFRVKTDSNGRIQLGELEGVRTISVRTDEEHVQKWGVSGSQTILPQRLEVMAGEAIVLPHSPDRGTPGTPAYALYEVATAPAPWERVDGRDPHRWPFLDGYPVRRSQRTRTISIEGGFVRIQGLEADRLFELRHRPSGQTVMIHVHSGEERRGRYFSDASFGTLSTNSPLHIVGAAIEGDALVVRLENATPSTLVHVTASRYRTGPSPFQGHAAEPPHVQSRSVVTAETEYLSGRVLSDEHQYILDRQLVRHFPGVPVQRPVLLLNPWAQRETDTTRFDGRGGTDFEPDRTAVMFGSEAAPDRPEWSDTGDAWLHLDFLPRPARVFTNLTPSERGVIRIPAADLAHASLVRVVAVDETQQVAHELLLPARPLTPRDLTLPASLDAETPFTQTERITAVEAGGSLRIDDASNAEFEVFADLESVYDYFLLLNGETDLEKFEFLLRWPSLSIAEKRELYSENACHELHVFLFEKDPEFFAQVVRPFLANKKDPTFLDRYFIGSDLSEYLDPWRFEQLNVFERILLAGRLPGERESIERHLRDLVEVDPVSEGEEADWFESAISATALNVPLYFGSPPVFEGDEEMESAPLELLPSRDARSDGDADESAKEETAERSTARREAFSLSGRNDADKPSPFLRPLGATTEYAENNYYRLPLAEQGSDRVKASPFWAAYARHRSETPDQPFVPTSFAASSRNFTEMVFTLAVLDLPFSGGTPRSSLEDGHLTIEASTPLIVFHREIRPSRETGDSEVLVGQSYFRVGEFYSEDHGIQHEKRIQGEFIRGVAYVDRVVVSNPTAEPVELVVLIQIPQGAVPLAANRATRSEWVRIQPNESKEWVELFYFPRSGRFTHYPVHVSQDGRTLAHTEPRTIVVVDRATQVDTTTWEYVSQDGTPQQLLDFLDDKNPRLLDLETIAWRLVDPRSYQAFAEPLFELLSRRKIYCDPLWAYSLLHHDRPRIREYLRHQEELYELAGSGLESPLVTTDPIERKWYEHLEYRPLVNARAHPFGGQIRIANLDLASHYTDFCRLLSLQPELDDEDRLAATYYLLLQDRHVEALDLFASIDRERVPSKIQFDYTAAYLDLLSDRPQIAGRIAADYRDYPVPHWRDRFRAIAEYLDPSRPARDGEPRSTAELAEREPTFDLRVGAQRVALDYRNLERAQVNYYPMDVELHFSSQPFVRSNASSSELEQWAMILPTLSEPLDLPAGQSTIDFELPEQFRSSNVIVEVVAAGKRQSRAHYANTLSVTVSRNYGQLQVVDTRDRTPLSKAYVKVYARQPSGAVRFYKDGYTDLQGRFDYVSVSTQEVVTDFALLVLHDGCGAAILETPSPQR